MRWLGLASLAALAAACSGNTPGPSADNGGGSSAGGKAVTPTGGGGMMTSPQAGTSSAGSSAQAGATSGGDSGSGGSVAMGGSTGSGGSSTEMITAPEGKIPNLPMDAGTVNLPRDQWPDGIIAPTFEEGNHQNQPVVLNGYLEGAGNAQLCFYDISDPTMPKFLSRKVSPGFDPKAGPKGEGEAESHQTSLARYGNKFYQVLTSGLGVDIWDVTDQRNPRVAKQIKLDGVNYGDFTEAVWGMYWQGNTIYVGATNNGVYVLDATNPEDPKVVKQVTSVSIGGVNAGPLYALGNVLIVTTPKENAGIAKLDISDPLNPVTLQSFKPPGPSYIGALYGHHLFLQSPLRAWDVFSDPLKISGTADSPAGKLTTESSEYMSFSDGNLFLGHLRPNAGVSKIDVTDVTKMAVKSRVWGRLEFTQGDDQFSIAVGSLVVLADDEKPYRGMTIAAHSTEPDKTPPVVDTVLPKDGATGLSKKVRVGLSMTDNIELATVHPGSVIVRPMGGEPLKGSYGLYMGILNFDPDEDLLPNTTYEVVLPKDGVKDLVGNGIAAEFKSTFTTAP
jgi:hypothetical protein